MNVYAIEASGDYCAGQAIVAAGDEAQAKKVAAAIKNSTWNVDYAAPDNVELLPCTCEGEPRVLTHFEYGE